MSLIARNNKTIQNIAIIILKYAHGKKEITINGDFTIIKIKDEIVGININNASKYIDDFSGIKSLNDNHIKKLNENNIQIKKHVSFKIGEVITKEVHEKSNKLFVLKVKTDKEIQIVTNATNAEVGKKVVVAQINSVLPSGKAVIESKVLGKLSEGMLCGGSTLGLENTNGVLIVEGNNGDEFIL